MSAHPPIMSPGAFAQRWGKEPVLSSPAQSRRAACAVWEFSGGNGAVEIVSDPDPDTHIVSIFTAGRIRKEYFADGQRRFEQLYQPGLLNIVHAGERPRAILKGETATFSFLDIYLPGAVVNDLALQAGLASNPCDIRLIDPQIGDDREIKQIGRTLIEEMRDGGPLARLMIDALYQDLAIQLLRRHSNVARHPTLRRAPARGGLAPWQLTRTLEAMKAHLDEDISLDMLAGIAGCSPTHFSRAFKQSTGKPPFQWLLECRIERAKQLLADARMALAQVALAVGFAAQPQFTTAFKRVTGVTPGVWQRERIG